MNPMLKKLVDQEFMTEAHGEYLEGAVSRKESVIITGHKGHGILPLMATVVAVAKGNASIKQVKSAADVVEGSDYFAVADLKITEEFNMAAYENLISDILKVKNSSLITIKDPDHPYSLQKILGDVYKATGDGSKVYQVVECTKIYPEGNEEGVKMLKKITQMTYNEKGKLVKVDFKG
jgi:hypothetical protein